jgi:hypothetical protein
LGAGAAADRAALGDLDIEIMVFEPTRQYQNVAKRAGVEKLTPARALIAELVRRYWVLGMECSLLEIQKLAWFLERSIERVSPEHNPLELKFVAHKYGPYANRLDHLLNSLDGSYLRSEKRISDADPFDVIWFDDSRKTLVQAFLKSEAKAYLPALEATASLIDGFESPFGMELLATVDWLLARDGVEPPRCRHCAKACATGAAVRVRLRARTSSSTTRRWALPWRV